MGPCCFSGKAFTSGRADGRDSIVKSPVSFLSQGHPGASRARWALGGGQWLAATRASATALCTNQCPLADGSDSIDRDTVFVVDEIFLSK